MKRRNKVIAATAIFLLAVIGWFIYRILFTLSHIPEAYAAWDTGTLLVEYMKAHDNRWPTSWNDLQTVLNSDHGREILLRGSRADETIVQYAHTLQDHVSINWTFDPRNPRNDHPVTRNDGSPFPMVWQGAEPNEMVREYLAEKPATKPST